ncbi:MAG: hypothetical protein ACPL3C_02920 [Pyrobaculum sp.]
MRPVPAAEPLSGKPHWAKVAENMAFENASLTRYFLSWLSMYLWAAEGDGKAVAEFLTAAVMGDGSIQTREVTLAVGKFSTDEEKTGPVTHVHKAALVLGVLAKAGHAPERVYARARGEGRWFELEWGAEKAVRFSVQRLSLAVRRGAGRRRRRDKG